MEVIKEQNHLSGEKEKIKQNLKKSSSIQIFFFAFCPILILFIANLYFSHLKGNTHLTYKKVWDVQLIVFLIVDLLIFSYFLTQYIFYRKIDNQLNKLKHISSKLRRVSLLLNIKGLTYEKSSECKIKRFNIILKKNVISLVFGLEVLFIIMTNDGFNIFHQDVTTYKNILDLISVSLFLLLLIFTISSLIFDLIIYFYYGEDKKSLKIISILTLSYIEYKKIILLNQELSK